MDLTRHGPLARRIWAALATAETSSGSSTRAFCGSCSRIQYVCIVCIVCIVYKALKPDLERSRMPLPCPNSAETMSEGATGTSCGSCSRIPYVCMYSMHKALNHNLDESGTWMPHPNRFFRFHRRSENRRIERI